MVSLNQQFRMYQSRVVVCELEFDNRGADSELEIAGNKESRIYPGSDHEREEIDMLHSGLLQHFRLADAERK